MLSRRGFLGMIAGVLSTPALKPLADFVSYAAPESSLSKLVQVYYDQKAIAILKATTPFLAFTKQRPLPVFEGGRTIQFFTYLPEVHKMDKEKAPVV